jgi:hypothetical protein
VDIAKWDAGTWIAVAGAVIALVAAWSSWWQARAARQQVAIMRRQLQNETDDRHEAAGPVFSLRESVAGTTPKGQPAAKITVVQEGGPALSEVTVTVQRTEGIRGLFGEDGPEIVDAITWKDNAPGTTRHLLASLDLKGQGLCNIVLNFRVIEDGTGATWNRTRTTIPEIPFTIRKFGWPSARISDEEFFADQTP